MEQSFSDAFIGMNRYDGSATVDVSHEMVTSFYSDNFETEFSEGLEQSFTVETWQIGHTSTEIL